MKTLFFHTFHRYLRSLKDQRYREAFDQSEWDRTEQIVWSDMDPEGQDKFGAELNEAITRFDGALKAHLRR